MQFTDTEDGYKIIWHDGLIFPELASEDKVRIESSPAERGKILDRNERMLAGPLINGRIPFYKSFLVRICGMGRIRHPVHFLIIMLPNLFHISDKKLFRRLPAAAPHEINNPADCCKCCGYRQDSRSDVDTLFIPFVYKTEFCHL